MNLNEFYAKVTVAAEPGGYEPQPGDNFERRSGFAYKLPEKNEINLVELMEAQKHANKMREELSQLNNYREA